jgi:hypothetical protein
MIVPPVSFQPQAGRPAAQAGCRDRPACSHLNARRQRASAWTQGFISQTLTFMPPAAPAVQPARDELVYGALARVEAGREPGGTVAQA